MKSIKIIGKRNVDSFKPKSERKRKILNNVTEKNELLNINFILKNIFNYLLMPS